MVSKNILAASITSAPDLLKLGKAGANEYAELVQAVSNRHIGGSFVYLLNTPKRDLTLIHNPLMRRYSDYSAAVGDITAPNIGEAYDPYEREFSHIPVFLDQVGGSLGFYWDNGYKKVVFDTGGRLVEHSGTRNEVRMAPIYDNIRKLYSKGVYAITGDEERTSTFLRGADDIGEYHPYFYDINVKRETPERISLNISDIDGPLGTFIKNTENGGYGYETYKKGLYNEEGDLQIYGDSNTDREFFEIDEAQSKKGGLLSYTAKLFREGKINSLISRFETNNNEDTGGILSRGRRLGYSNNRIPSIGGYDNAYVRTWTAVRQYGKYKDSMSHYKDENGEIIPFKELQESLGSMRSPKSKLDKFGVMGDRPIPRITPEKSGIDGKWYDTEYLKSCMFSIENLAWRDINPSSYISMNDDESGELLNTTLSDEQKGPNGGRIMWFPPYGLSFTENVNARWESNTFIGRGENIYTYINTERRGTLDFILLVDHPSRIDRWKNEEDSIENIEQLLRYFAGEGPLINTEKVSQNVIPTPDIEPSRDEKLDQNATFKKYFAVFFPNNYSGTDDMPDALLGKLYGTEGQSYEFSNTTPCKTDPQYGGKFTYWVDKEFAKQNLERSSNYDDSMPFALNDPSHRSTETNKMILSYFKIPLEDGSMVGSINELNRWLEDVNSNDKGWKYTLTITGYATSHGSRQNNVKLWRGRIQSILRLINAKCGGSDATLFTRKGTKDETKEKYLFALKNSSIEVFVVNTFKESVVENKNISDFYAKLGRSVSISIEGYPINDGVNVLTDDTQDIINMVTSDPEEYLGEENNEIREYTTTQETALDYGSPYSYDNEYLYFKEISDSDGPLKKSIVSKIKYFDPAYHSITPEGFNARLTFLHQCTRQGPTNSNSDGNGGQFFGAGNLAFGRPPFCILRIGDFFHTKICIDSMTISYDNDGGIQWDLNKDGIGVQPMYAKISLNFTFLGGQDISGPIARLQNAASYNYYANTSVYDVRSDYREHFATEDNDEALVWSPIYVDKGRTESFDTVPGAYDSAKHRKWATRKNNFNNTNETSNK